MTLARLLFVLVAVCHRRGGVTHYGAVSASDDPVLSELRSQLMANNYDYQQSESIEQALRAGAERDAAPRADDRAAEPNYNRINDESELSDFKMDRNVLNGYITDMSDINVKPALRTNDDTFTGDGQENVDELSDAESAHLSEWEPEGAPPGELSAKTAPPGARDQQASKAEPQPTPAGKRIQPNLAPVNRAQLDQVPASELEQVAEELPQGDQSPQQVVPVQPAGQQIHVVSPYLVGDQTTEGIPFKVLTGHGQKHGRRSGAGVVSYLQTQLNETVVVAPLGPGPMPDFQLPSGRRQFREISEDEDQEEEITSSKEKIIDSRRAV